MTRWEVEGLRQERLWLLQAMDTSQARLERIDRLLDTWDLEREPRNRYREMLTDNIMIFVQHQRRTLH